MVGLALFHANPLHTQTFTSIPALPFDTSGPVIRAGAQAQKPFTVAGERGVVLGQQDGTFEAWVLPVKLLSHLTLEAQVEGYSVPIDVNQQAAQIEVRPDRTIITYAHIAFTVRQIMFAPDFAAGPDGAKQGPLVLFEFDCLHPTDFTFRFTPNLEWMWPERNEGVPGVEWVSKGGYYVLHSDYPDLAGAVTLPGATPGILAPYQERPQVHPVELKLHIDPARDHGRLFPLLMAAGMTPAAATNSALGATLEQMNTAVAANYKAHAEYWKKFLTDSVSIETPDKSLNEAFRWAEISIEQLRTRVPGTSETALVAGYYASGDSARPGFGWFFGRDSLYTLYAVNGFGDFALSKSELEFLIHRQRADGKIMHEYSQTAAAVDWQQFPYEYAAADSTPLFLLAVDDYYRASGDKQFLMDHRDAIEKAWALETDPAHDTDHDGIYDNSQGTGWVESWPGGMPHQEIYLALLDEQASAAMVQIESLLGDTTKSSAAQSRADTIAKTIEAEYYDKEKGCYAFSHNADGSQDRTTTVYPALAWWSSSNLRVPQSLSPAVPRSLSPPQSLSPSVPQPLLHAGECLKQLADASLQTDWGLRDVANTEKIYDGTSYHQGSVWPLFTGWAALAEYRGNQPLAGYQMLKENANLTWAQDLGADTELLSGDFYIPFGRSTSHQLWSSAMVITPTLRGLFGISIDAAKKEITVNPHLPAGWDEARVKNLHLGGTVEDLDFRRDGGVLTAHLYEGKKEGWTLRSDEPGSENREDHLSSNGLMIAIPLPAIEVLDGRYSWIDFDTGAKHAAINSPQTAPGSRTERVRVVAESWSDHKATLTFEGPAGATGLYLIARHHLTPNLKIDCPDVMVKDPTGGSRQVSCTSMIDTAHRDQSLPIMLTPQLPPGDGWKTITVTLSW